LSPVKSCPFAGFVAALAAKVSSGYSVVGHASRALATAATPPLFPVQSTVLFGIVPAFRDSSSRLKLFLRRILYKSCPFSSIPQQKYAYA
jgi:hypothetical protein